MTFSRVTHLPTFFIQARKGPPTITIPETRGWAVQLTLWLQKAGSSLKFFKPAIFWFPCWTYQQWKLRTHDHILLKFSAKLQQTILSIPF